MIKMRPMRKLLTTMSMNLMNQKKSLIMNPNQNHQPQCKYFHSYSKSFVNSPPFFIQSRFVPLNVNFSCIQISLKYKYFSYMKKIILRVKNLDLKQTVGENCKLIFLSYSQLPRTLLLLVNLELIL